MTPEAHALLRELTALNGGEAVFRPSSIGRTIACPGSIIAAARVRSAPVLRDGMDHAMAGRTNGAAGLAARCRRAVAAALA